MMLVKQCARCARRHTSSALGLAEQYLLKTKRGTGLLKRKTLRTIARHRPGVMGMAYTQVMFEKPFVACAHEAAQFNVMQFGINALLHTVSMRGSSCSLHGLFKALEYQGQNRVLLQHRKKAAQE